MTLRAALEKDALLILLFFLASLIAAMISMWAGARHRIRGHHHGDPHDPRPRRR